MAVMNYHYTNWLTLYDIHISFLPFQARKELQNLNNYTALHLGIWELAAEFGYTTADEINAIEENANKSKHKSAILSLLKVLDERDDVSIGKLYDALVKLKRRGSEVIQQYMQEILYNFTQKKKPMQQRNGQQHREPSICNCTECWRAAYHMSLQEQCPRNPYPNISGIANCIRSHSGVSYMHDSAHYTGNPIASDTPHPVSRSQGSSFSLPNNLPTHLNTTGYRHSDSRHSNDRHSSSISHSTGSMTSSIGSYNDRYNQEQFAGRKQYSNHGHTQPSPETSKRGHHKRAGRHRKQSNKSRNQSNMTNSTDQYSSSSDSGAYAIGYDCNDGLKTLPGSRSTNQEVVSELEESFGQLLELQKSHVPDYRCSPDGESDIDGASQTNVKVVFDDTEDGRRANLIFFGPCASKQSSVKTMKGDHERNSWHGEEPEIEEPMKKTVSDGLVQYGGRANPRPELNNNTDDEYSEDSVVCYNNDLDVSDSEYAQSMPDVDRNIRAEHSNSSNGAASSRKKSKDKDKKKTKERNIRKDEIQVLRKSRIKVFITYTWNPLRGDLNVIFDDMKSMIKYLPKNLVNVTADLEFTCLRAITRNLDDWLEEQINGADYIIACITPTYAEDIKCPQDNEVQARPIQLNARYIFDRIRSEYRANGCQNKRVIPVKFANTGATDKHVPDCFRSTLVYTFPRDRHTIAKVILDEPLSLEEMNH